jgi:hypothetical protein
MSRPKPPSKRSMPFSRRTGPRWRGGRRPLRRGTRRTTDPNGRKASPGRHQADPSSAPLPGGYRGVLVAAAHDPDPFCFNCGVPHRWATREQRVRHLENLLEFKDLDDAAQLTVIEQLAVLSAPADEVDDAQRAGAAERVRRLAPKLWETGLPVIQSVLTEAAKKQLGL